MINLSDTTPVATSGRTNVTWAKDASGNVSASTPDPPVTSVAGKTGAVTLTESDIASLTSDLSAKAPTSRTITTTAPLTGGGDLSADRTLAISNFGGDSGSGGTKGAVPAPGSGDGTASFLKADGTWAVPGGGTTTGTVTSVGLTVPSWLTVGGGPVTTDGTLAVTGTTGQAANSFLATPDGSTGAVGLRTIAAADVPVFVASGASHAPGAVPDPGASAGSTHFLREDGTWAAPAGAFTSPLSTKGDVHVYSTTDARLAVGTDGQYLAADSAQATGLKWNTRSVKPQFSIGSGATGTAVGGYAVAPLAGAITTGRIVITASDASVDLTFDIKQNGTTIFSTPPTITHGASVHSVTDLTSALASNPTTVAAGDYFELDITSGSSSWIFFVGMA
jgi:hypothetical protein